MLFVCERERKGAALKRDPRERSEQCMAGERLFPLRTTTEIGGFPSAQDRAPLSWTNEQADMLSSASERKERAALKRDPRERSGQSARVSGGALSSANDDEVGGFPSAQDRAPLSWTNKRADMLFVCERERQP